MRMPRLLAAAAGLCGLTAVATTAAVATTVAVAVAPGAAAVRPAATGPAGSSVAALADVAVRPGVRHLGRAQAGPPTTADCEQAYKVACYSPAQIRQAYHLPAVYAVAGYDLAAAADG